ncbi:hypothetical protein FJY69_03000 [candidate division WOR-3 bacterium]|nr:hypothetical protein [candidate division WOR-3 bacterium]
MTACWLVAGCSALRRAIEQTAPAAGRPVKSSGTSAVSASVHCPRCRGTGVTVRYEHRCPNGTVYAWIVSGPGVVPGTNKPVNAKCPGCGTGSGTPVLLSCRACGYSGSW